MKIPGCVLEKLKGLLQYYINTRMDKYNISLIRLPSRMGLIRARLQGARVATGDVLIFLDAHCEATLQWMEPLLAGIEDDRASVLVPIIDVIEANNFAYSTNGIHHIFKLNLPLYRNLFLR